MRIAPEKMTSIPVKELEEWAEDDIEEELLEIDSLKFVEHHVRVYRDKLEKALANIYLHRTKMSENIENGEW